MSDLREAASPDCSSNMEVQLATHYSRPPVWRPREPDLFCPRYRMSDRSDSLYPSMWDNMEPSSDVGMEAGPTHVGGWGSSIGGWGTSRMNRPGGMPPPQAHTGHPPHTPHTPHPLFPPPPHPHHPGPNPQHPGRIDVPPVGMMPGGGIGMSNMGPSQPPTSVGSPGALVVPQPMKAPRTIKTYHCRMCDQIFESKSDLLVHSQHVHKQDPKPYKCPTCNKCFANSSYLSQHARIHSGIKPYKCQICERRFTQLCHLQQHIRTHTGEKPYKCQHPGCGKAFSQLSNLQSHSRSHMTDKPYRCNSCYKCFTDEQSLREHIPKHSETKHIKTHICRICGKAYTQETYLARHMTKHTGDGGPQQMGVQQQQQQQQHPGGIGGGRIGLPPGGLASPPGSQANNMIVNKSMSSSVPPGPPPSVGPPHIPDNDPLKSPDLDGTSGSGLVNVGGPLDVDPNKGSSMSAFMPLGHQFTGPTGLMSNSVPSSGFPFSAPRLPTNTLNSPLSHITSGTTSRSYFPFDHPIPFPAKRDMDRQGPMGPISREGMMANTLLSLQQIKNFSSSHPVFPKSEPSSPVHKNF